jgi:hypothetical protein
MIFFFSLSFLFFPSPPFLLSRKVAPGGAAHSKKSIPVASDVCWASFGAGAAKSPWYVRDESAVVCEGAHFLKTPYKSGVRK